MSRFIRGFTLIELIVVVAIIMIMGAGALAGYRRFNDRQVLLTSGKELLVNLRQAQGKATSGIKIISNPGCPSTATLVGYRVQAGAGNLSSYTVEQACQSGAAISYSQSRTFRLATGAAFENAFSVTFLGQFGGVSAATTIRIIPTSMSTQTQRYTVTIDQSGSITDGGLQ